MNFCACCASADIWALYEDFTPLCKACWKWYKIQEKNNSIDLKDFIKREKIKKTINVWKI